MKTVLICRVESNPWPLCHIHSFKTKKDTSHPEGTKVLKRENEIFFLFNAECWLQKNLKKKPSILTLEEATSSSWGLFVDVSFSIKHVSWAKYVHFKKKSLLGPFVWM